MTSLEVDPRDQGVGLRTRPGASPHRAVWRLGFHALLAVRGELASWIIPWVVAPYVITRVAIVLVAQVASISIDHLTDHGPVAPAYTTSWFDPLLLFDARWYMDIAANWYRYNPEPGVGQTSLVFFPLYPFLIRVANAVFDGGAADSIPAVALIIANVFAVLGLALLYRLALREFGASVAQRTIWYVLVFPASFYLSSAYAEPVFLAACVGAIYAARTQHWYLASLAGVAATLSRPFGVLIVAPLVFEYLRQNWGDPGRLVRLRAVAILMPLVALAGWMGYLYTVTGDPLVFVHEQSAWNQQHLTSFVQTLYIAFRRTRDQQLQGRLDLGGLQFGVAAIAVAASVVSWRALPWSYALFASVLCVVVLSSGSTMSIWRHVSLIFPLFMVAARAGAWNVFDRAYIGVSLIMAGFFLTLLVTNWTIVS